ncbi:MAG: Trk system potassium uptake protein TrkA [Holosporales bacterium]
MKVLILGAGRVGYSIARYLAYEEYTSYDVTIVDNNPHVLEKTAEKLDIQPVLGHASYPDVLKSAGIENADLVIAVTASDEVNIVACEVAQALFNVPSKIARVRGQSYLNPQWVKLFQSKNIGVDRIISPEAEVAKSLNRSMEVVGAFHVLSLCNDLVKVIGVRAQPGAPILNTPLRLLPTVLPQINMVLLSVTRNGETIFPTERDMILENDEVFFAATQDDVLLCMESFGHYDHTQRNVMIVGGGNIGYTFAQDMENIPNMSVHLIEKEAGRCEFLAKQLKKTEIFQGDALDTELLNSLSLQNCEGAICVTNDDKVNILSGLLMKRQGAQRCLTLLNGEQYTSLVTSLGIDAIISPRSVTVSTILQSIRHGRIETVHTLGDGHSEILEAKARESSHIIGLNVEDISLTNELMIVALVRDGIVNFNPSRMIVSIGDILLMITRKECVRKLERLFSIRPTYLYPA